MGGLWPDALVQRCTVHKHRNLLAHAPRRLHDEISADYNDMIYAKTPKEIEAAPQVVHPQMATEVPRGRRQPGGGRRPAVHLHPVARASGNRRAPRMPSSGCTKNSSAASRRKPCCPRRRRRRCCSGRCSPPARSPCARSTGGTRLPSSPRFNALTLPHEAITSARRRRHHVNFHQLRYTTRGASRQSTGSAPPR